MNLIDAQTVLAATPLNGLATRVIAIIVTLAAVVVAWAGFKVLARAGQGNVKRDMNVGASTGMGVMLLVVALALTAVTAFISGIVHYVIG